MRPCQSDKPWLVIVNPNSGKKKGKKDWVKIAQLLDQNFKYTAIFTERRGHAISIVKEKILEGTRNIIVAGGDGTMNEVVNAVFTQGKVPTNTITLGIITIGTGNDWGKMFGIPASYEKSIETIKNCKTFIQDAGIIRYYDGEIQKNRFFLNIAGLGFDALVAKKINAQKDIGKSGKLLYMANLISNLWRYRYMHTNIKIDDKKFKDEIFTISIGIGVYSGGGMKQTPNSIPNDGLFDLTIIKKMRKIGIIKSLPLLYNGKILEHPKVVSFRGAKINIECDPPIHLEADGETLGHSPIEIEIIPKSIRVITGDHPYS